MNWEKIAQEARKSFEEKCITICKVNPQSIHFFYRNLNVKI